MRDWVRNTLLYFEDSLNLKVLFFWNTLHYKILEILIFLKYFTSFNSSNMLLNFELLNHFTY